MCGSYLLTAALILLQRKIRREKIISKIRGVNIYHALEEILHACRRRLHTELTLRNADEYSLLFNLEKAQKRCLYRCG
jgi:hypothetical protein